MIGNRICALALSATVALLSFAALAKAPFDGA